MQRGYKEIFLFYNFFWLLVKFWTLLYSSKTQCSNSEKANFLGFEQGLFWSPYMCVYLSFGILQIRLQGRTVMSNKIVAF